MLSEGILYMLSIIICLSLFCLVSDGNDNGNMKFYLLLVFLIICKELLVFYKIIFFIWIRKMVMG